MADCRACGAPVVWADREDGNGRIPLEVHEQAAGEDRYTVEKGVAIPVPASASVLAHQDHRAICRYGPNR